MTTLGTPQVAEELGFITFRKIPRNHSGVTSLCWCHLPETQSFVLHHRILCPFLNSYSISGAFSILHRKQKNLLFLASREWGECGAFGVSFVWGWWVLLVVVFLYTGWLPTYLQQKAVAGPGPQGVSLLLCQIHTS